MKIPRRESEKVRIEVIPMIDIVFFLLVFFMISTLSMTVNRSLPVDLPKAASTQQELGETANLTVTKDGALFLNKEPVTLQEMAPKLKAELAKVPELFVVISADDHTSHGTIVDVIDEMRLAGVSRLAIAVNPERSTQP